ncbi:glycosyl transferase family 1 [Oligella sp. HMSC05A10]|uniref:glycosyltransferase n=1 Tax=Oligella sp. HMSC05A10 TaxID=1581112 RepID=UPI0008A4132C|nr:glycosyltransferase [Oligella sp. HMSC05A10]OFS87271.1 glycosyl transferase family 1 [Oligella sp. HMSC05A10]
MTRKYHILIIPSWYPAYSGDINGSFFREQAIALRKRGHKVGVLAPTIRSLRDYKSFFNKPYGISYEDDEGVQTFRYHSINITAKMHRLSVKRWERIGERLFKKYVDSHGKPEVIHVHSMVYAGYIALHLHISYKIPYVITEHSSSFLKGLISNGALTSLQKVVDNSSQNLAVSKIFTTNLDKKFKENTWTYIPNIVNDDFLKVELNNCFEQFTFINVCFLDRNKRVDLLISAFATAFKGNNKVRLKIGGSGTEELSLKTLSEKLGVSEQVTFLGRLSREQVKRELSRANALVLSSDYETFGVVLIEALALGKPIISTKSGGPESIIVPQVGYLVEKDSVDGLASGMCHLFENYEKFDPKSIRQYCFEQFSEDAVCKKLENVYQSVLTV